MHLNISIVCCNNHCLNHSIHNKAIYFPCLFLWVKSKTFSLVNKLINLALKMLSRGLSVNSNLFQFHLVCLSVCLIDRLLSKCAIWYSLNLLENGRIISLASYGYDFGYVSTLPISIFRSFKNHGHVLILWRCIGDYPRTRVHFMSMWRRGQSGTWPSAKISPSQDSYFGHMVNRQIMWRLIWSLTDLRRW